MSAIVTQAYAEELERYHNWMLRGTMKVAFNAAPGKDVVVSNLLGLTPLSTEPSTTSEPSTTDVHIDQHRPLYDDLATVVEAQRAVMRAMDKPLFELQIEPSSDQPHLLPSPPSAQVTGGAISSKVTGGGSGRSQGLVDVIHQDEAGSRESAPLA